jgi:probable F420-dependent oxidoreductase
MSEDKIRFGTALRSPYDVAKAAAQIEDLGFDILSCGEHVTFHGDSANGIVSLSVAAGATEHINLMSSITLLPLYPPALLAKMGAALDIASGGRFILGVGVGGENPKEFEACSVPVKQRGSRTDECLEILERVWTNTDVSYEGRYTVLDNFSLKPLPLQKPRPPIWVSGRKEVAMRRAARYGDGWLPYMYTPEQLADSIEKIKAYGAEIGRDLSDFQPGLFIFTNVNEDGKLALAQAAETLGKTYAQDFTQLVGKYALAGNPDQVQARLNEYIEAGARTILLSAACADENLDDNLSAIANHIVQIF